MGIPRELSGIDSRRLLSSSNSDTIPGDRPGILQILRELSGIDSSEGTFVQFKQRYETPTLSSSSYRMAPQVDFVIFDLDGTLINTEAIWERVASALRSSARLKSV